MKKKTLVLIHGWGTSNYNGSLPKNAPRSITWENRAELVSLLQKSYHLFFYNLPGFGGEIEPKQNFFNLEDFSNHFNNWLKSQKVKPDAIVGYSFGGAVTLNHKINFSSPIPIILVSPALKRQETAKSHFANFIKNLFPLAKLQYTKHLYQLLFSKYYRKGTPFLRASYDKIARRDITNSLKKLNPNQLLLIYGESDTSTPVKYVTHLAKKYKLNLKIIKNGDHEIGQTHPKEILKSIKDFTR